VVVSYRLKS